MQDGVEVPPEEEEFPIEEEVDLALLETNEAEDLSYAAMFANTLNIGKESLETPQKTQDGQQWSSDPIVQPPSTGQVRCKTLVINYALPALIPATLPSLPVPILSAQLPATSSSYVAADEWDVGEAAICVRAL